MTPRDALDHTEGGSTTRDELDAGVPMAPGDGPQGPEDAFDPKSRGDYSDRTDQGPHMWSVPVEGGGEPVRDEKGRVVDFKPRAQLEPQTPEEG